MPSSRADDLLSLDEPAFLSAWERIVGEPPAVMLERAEMVAILLDLMAAEKPGLPVRPAASDPACRG